ncbi:hypothetical protein AWC22_20830 [Mycobacterium riyadhense]|uniref:Uncharacterized protein n=1 Tax=Mycobacterium riyadhense TaxID=486698 RepID=A0A1X2CNG7_9MYCO|nr:hypothetical protein AWC22_20830 [Mycobacterium riyadhense]
MGGNRDSANFIARNRVLPIGVNTYHLVDLLLCRTNVRLGVGDLLVSEVRCRRSRRYVRARFGTEPPRDRKTYSY